MNEFLLMNGNIKLMEFLLSFRFWFDIQDERHVSHFAEIQTFGKMINVI